MKIKTLVLATNNLNAVTHFYNKTLGFHIQNRSENLVSFQIGESILTFELNNEVEHPTYHYALNIPANQIEAAKQWLSKRVTLIKDEKGNDTIDLSHWNAHALYFYDSVGNIGELIARHDLDNHAETDFSMESIYAVSEIGLPVADVLGFKTVVQNHFDTPNYKSASAKFAALGDENGLFICVPLDRVWFPTVHLKAASFPVLVEIEGNRTASLEYENYKILTSTSDV